MSTAKEALPIAWKENLDRVLRRRAMFSMPLIRANKCVWPNITQNIEITRSPLTLVMADGGCFVDRICGTTLKRENAVMNSIIFLCFVKFIVEDPLFTFAVFSELS